MGGREIGGDQTLAMRAAIEVTETNRGRVSDPGQAALSGSQSKPSGSAGGYLLKRSRDLFIAESPLQL
jgi:hypothetical protein